MVDFVTIANNAIAEIKRVKRGSLRFSAPVYLAISTHGSVESSSLWLILKNANLAALILPYKYRVITAEDSSAFILFIDNKGNCNDSIDLNGWKLKFDAPIERLYRTYQRSAIISKAGHKVFLKTPHGTITPDDFKRIWNYFRQISTINEDFASLPLYQELYDNNITITSLREDNIRKEYTLFCTEAIVKANEELLENLKHIVKSTK